LSFEPVKDVVDLVVVAFLYVVHEFLYFGHHLFLAVGPVILVMLGSHKTVLEIKLLDHLLEGYLVLGIRLPRSFKLLFERLDFTAHVSLEVFDICESI
jgi:hypothetical protein